MLSRSSRLFYSTNTKKNLSKSSTRYLDRQSRDPFVKQAKQDQFRARSSYKLIEILNKHKLLSSSSSQRIVDCGAAPGGWSQVISRRSKKSPILAIDLLPMQPIPGVHFIRGDFLDPSAQLQITQWLDGQTAGLLLSDMAPSFTGHHSVDAARTMDLCENVLAFGDQFLARGGNLVLKFFMGGQEAELRQQLRRKFRKVVVDKPDASRRQSSELYFVCQYKL